MLENAGVGDRRKKSRNTEKKANSFLLARRERLRVAAQVNSLRVALQGMMAHADIACEMLAASITSGVCAGIHFEGVFCRGWARRWGGGVSIWTSALPPFGLWFGQRVVALWW